MRRMAKKQHLRATRATFAKAFKNYAPPEPLTVSRWAEKYRILSRESAAEAGPWRNDRTPYMVEPMDAIDDPRVHDIAVVAMSQTGKSELELNAIGKFIDQDPAPILYVQPSLDDAKKFSSLRVAPMIRDCARLRRKVSDIKSRDSRNTILQKSFPGGMLTMVGSQTPSALASMPVRYVIGDEIDRFARSAGAEGDPWELAEKRTTTFYNAKRIAVSTPPSRATAGLQTCMNRERRKSGTHAAPIAETGMRSFLTTSSSISTRSRPGRRSITGSSPCIGAARPAGASILRRKRADFLQSGLQRTRKQSNAGGVPSGSMRFSPRGDRGTILF